MDLGLTEMLVYATLYNRTSLSIKHNWIDDSGRVYICYPVDSLAEAIHRSLSVTKAALKKLEVAGLIERKRNFAAPSTIYVKLPAGRNSDPRTVGIPTVSQSENRPIDSRNPNRQTAGKQAERKAGKPDEREPENRLTDSRKTGPRTAGKPDVLYNVGATRNSYSSSKAAPAASRTDSDLAEIVQHFQQVIGDFPRSALDKLQSYREVFPKELICRAFDEAAESGVRNWRYIDGILRGWKADGVRTLGDVEARREARRKPEPPQERKMEVLT